MHKSDVPRSSEINGRVGIFGYFSKNMSFTLKKLLNAKFNISVMNLKFSIFPLQSRQLFTHSSLSLNLRILHSQ